MQVTVHSPRTLRPRSHSVTNDRSAFVTKAVRRALREGAPVDVADEISRINSVADQLNREAAEVLEYQVIR